MMPTQKKTWFWSPEIPEEVDFEAVYREQLPRIYNFFRYRFGDDALAEDLCADTFTKAWQNRHRYRQTESAVTTWIFTIARRVAIDQYRRSRPVIRLEDAPEPIDNKSPVQMVDERFTTEHLDNLLSQLPDRERELVALKYGAGLTNRSIAALVGLSESNVGVILFRVVAILRSRWEASNE